MAGIAAQRSARFESTIDPSDIESLPDNPTLPRRSKLPFTAKTRGFLPEKRWILVRITKKKMPPQFYLRRRNS
jgi:hypothetical protein